MMNKSFCESLVHEKFLKPVEILPDDGTRVLTPRKMYCSTKNRTRTVPVLSREKTKKGRACEEQK